MGCALLYVGDSRAFAATISNTRGIGRYAIHYRDPTTGRVPLHQSYPTLTIYNGWGSNWTPQPTGTEPPEFELQHHPSVGYLAYLVEGRWTFLETLQFSAYYNIFLSNPDSRNGTQGTVPCENSPMTTRGAAWAWRTTGQAAALSPTASTLPAADTALQASFAASVGNTAAYNKAVYIDGSLLGGARKNTIGWLNQYDGGDEGPAAEWWGRTFMVRFQSQALGHISDLGIENFSAQTSLEAVRNFSYEGVLRLVGDDTTWNWRRLAQYNAPYLKNRDKSKPQFMTTAEAFASYRSWFGLSALSGASGGTLKKHSSDIDIPNGTWRLVQYGRRLYRRGDLRARNGDGARRIRRGSEVCAGKDCPELQPGARRRE